MGDRRRENSDKLIQAAYELVPEVGISGLRTRDIAARAGVNLAAVHYCFAGKDELLEALYTYIREQIRAEVDRFLAPARSPQEMIAAHSELRVHLVRTQPTALSVWRCFVGEAWTNPVVRRLVARRFAEQRDRFATLLAQGNLFGSRCGVLPTDDPQVAGALVVSLYDGLLLQAALDPDGFDPAEYAAAIGRILGCPPGEERGQP